MNREKPNRGVSNMDVLKDIRGLLSVAQAREDVAVGEVKGSSGLEVEVARLETQIGGYKELIQKQQEELSVVKSEKEELAVRLKILNSTNTIIAGLNSTWRISNPRLVTNLLH